MLYVSVDNPEVRTYLPRLAAALDDWDGRALPGEPAFAALYADLQQAHRDTTLPRAGMRLNYEISGYRSLVMGTARRLERVQGPPYREALIVLDARWGELDYWRVARSASRPFTPHFLLAALDLRRDGAGAIVPAPPARAIYRTYLGRTLWITTMVTLLCVLIGYPIAYLIASSPPRLSRILLLLVLLPFWTSLLVRTAAWMVLLRSEGVVNGMLVGLGLLEQPAALIFNRFGVYVAMVHILLPFLVLPVYSVMKGVSPSHMRAAASLGARPVSAFLRVYLPQTLPGLAAGILVVFILGLGFYITPALVGGPHDQMLASLIAEFALGTANWGMASALAVVLLVCAGVLYVVFSRIVGFDRMKIG